MDLIKKLVRDINAKDEENLVFEKEKHELEDNVMNQKKCINKKAERLIYFTAGGQKYTQMKRVYHTQI